MRSARIHAGRGAGGTADHGDPGGHGLAGHRRHGARPRRQPGRRRSARCGMTTVMAQWEQDLASLYDSPLVPAIAFDGATLRLARESRPTARRSSRGRCARACGVAGSARAVAARLRAAAGVAAEPAAARQRGDRRCGCSTAPPSGRSTSSEAMPGATPSPAPTWRRRRRPARRSRAALPNGVRLVLSLGDGAA